MATNYETVTSLLKATCDAIREKEGSTELINHQDIPSRIQNLKSSRQDVLSLASGLTKYTEAFEVDGEQRTNVLVQPSDFSDETTVTWSSITTYFSHSIQNIEGSENGAAVVITATSTSDFSYDHTFWFDTTIDSSTSEAKSYLIAVRAKASKNVTSNLPTYMCYCHPTGSTSQEAISFSFPITTEWQIFYAIVNVPANYYMYDNTLAFYRTGDGIIYYVDWVAAYDITGSNFSNMTFGARATATNSNVLSGNTYYKDGILYTGTMTNKGKVTGSITNLSTPYTIPAGYHNGQGTVSISDDDLIASNIKSGVNILGVTGTLDAVSTDCNTWQVQNVGATYGFTKLSDGYYESTNQGIDSSVSLCKIKFRILFDSVITFSCINYAESSRDYGMIGVTNVILDETYNSNEYNDTTKIQKHFKNSNSSSAQTYTMTLAKGEYEVYIKYFKDGSVYNGNDSFKFKITDGAVEIDPNMGITPSTIVQYNNDYLDPGDRIEFSAGTYMPNGYSITANDSIISSPMCGTRGKITSTSCTTAEVEFSLDTNYLIGFVMWCSDKVSQSSNYSRIVMLSYISEDGSELTSCLQGQEVTCQSICTLKGTVNEDDICHHNHLYNEDDIRISILSNSMTITVLYTNYYRFDSTYNYYMLPIYSQL